MAACIWMYKTKQLVNSSSECQNNSPHISTKVSKQSTQTQNVTILKMRFKVCFPNQKGRWVWAAPRAYSFQSHDVD